MAAFDWGGQKRRGRPVVVRRRATFPFVVTQWSGGGHASGYVYLYENVGIFTDPTKDRPGIVYLYENVGVGPLHYPVVGRVVSQSSDAYGVAYAYENVT